MLKWPFPSENVQTWLASARVDCRTLGQQWGNQFSGTVFEFDDASTFWTSPSQFFTYYKNNVERTAKLSTIVRLANSLGPASPLNSTDLFFALLGSLATNLRVLLGKTGGDHPTTSIYSVPPRLAHAIPAYLKRQLTSTRLKVITGSLPLPPMSGNYVAPPPKVSGKKKKAEFVSFVELEDEMEVDEPVKKSHRWSSMYSENLVSELEFSFDATLSLDAALIEAPLLETLSAFSPFALEIQTTGYDGDNESELGPLSSLSSMFFKKLMSGLSPGGNLSAGGRSSHLALLSPDQWGRLHCPVPAFGTAAADRTT